LRAILVRHGQAFTNLEPEPDLPPDQLDRLTALGRAQARDAAQALKPASVRYVISSPMGRATETAEELRQALGLSAVTVEPRLRPLELGVGADGQPLDIQERWAEWKAGRDPVPARGESLEDVAERVLQVLREQHAAAPGATVVLVAHSEVIATVLGRVRGVPAPQRFPPSVPNCSLTIVELAAGRAPRVVAEAWKPPAQAALAPVP
jgi:broad specificity phosphatase PhoE